MQSLCVACMFAVVVCMYINACVSVMYFTPGPLLTHSHLETAAAPSRPAGGLGLDFGCKLGAWCCKQGGLGVWLCQGPSASLLYLLCINT